MKEIGGYFELDQFRSQEYYPDLIPLNLGRTALQFLLEQLHCKRLYLPYFLCDSVTEKAEEAACEVLYYHIDRNLVPLIDEEQIASITSDTYVYLVNYYGQLSDQKILEYKSIYHNIIVDHTHSFFQRPLPGIPTIYSCRKFFGLPDGAYVSCEGADASGLPQDVSSSRMTHILGRFEGSASDYYGAMLKQAGEFHHESVKTMSRLTKNLLGVIDYEKVRQKRNENYHFLSEQLKQYNSLHFFAPDGAFTYPFYSIHAAQIRKELAAKKIFVPAYWSCLLSTMPETSIEYDLSAHILPLPCDQRYSPEDLRRLVTELLVCLEKYGDL